MKQETIEGNKLIAEFMGKKKSTGFGLNFRFDTWYNGILLSDLKYHTSWDWLMPVVEKIVHEDSAFRMTIGNVAAICNFESQFEAKAKGEGKKYSSTNTIEAVWLAVVEFIKWKNQNQ